jgi:hypothetical protein
MALKDLFNHHIYHKLKINKRYKMADNRSGKDRRVHPDRRCGCTSSYNGPEGRATKYRRSDKDRREKTKI